MPIEYEMKYLYDTAAAAISRYSEDHTAAYWCINIENIVLENMILNQSYSLEYFKDYEKSAMKELIHRGLWVKWSSELSKPVLSPDPLNKLNIWDDSKPIKQGSD
jgi:hypothetical protein